MATDTKFDEASQRALERARAQGMGTIDDMFEAMGIEDDDEEPEPVPHTHFISLMSTRNEKGLQLYLIVPVLFARSFIL